MNKKSMWLSIISDEMMRDTMHAFIREIKSHNIEYESYSSSSGKRIYLHLKNVPKAFDDNLGNWIYYQPVSVVKKPNISDYDRIDW